jgi:hypothetical protein
VSEELRACPFCGAGSPREWPDSALIHCAGCGVQMHGDSPADAIAAWNRRVPVEHREPVGDLRKVLVKFGYRVVEVCARAEGFDNYAHSDWGIDFTEALNATLTEMGARPLYRAPSERVGE